MALPLVIVILGALSFFPTHLWGKTMYITDRIEISLRSGTGLDYRILTMLKTGDRVEVLEGDKNWSKVKLANGTVGWVNTDFLVDHLKGAGPTDSKLQEDLLVLKEENKNLIQEKDNLLKEKNQLQKEVDQAKQRMTALNLEKSPRNSSEIIALKTKNEQLDKEIIQYKKQLAQSGRTEYWGFTRERIQWFLIGSIVLIVGLLLGWILSRGRRKPPRYY